MTPLLFELEPRLPLFAPLCQRLQADPGSIAGRHFPDGESYLKVLSQAAGRRCILLADLSRPDDKFLPLTFLAATLRELGASQVGLVAPYLCYMRQDCRFSAGEAVTSRIFAERLSRELDWLVTVDPHLHRYRSLDEIYSIPAVAVSGAPALAQWLESQDEELLLVGPDEESRQWVEAIAGRIGQPFVVGEKKRSGDREVEVRLPDLARYRHRTAVIVDDVIASGHTLLETVERLRAAGMQNIDCLAVHGLFAEGADQKLLQSGVRRLVTSNSVPSHYNDVDLSRLLSGPIQALLGADSGGEEDTL